MSAPCTRAEEAARILAYARERLSDPDAPSTL